jgi:CDGSH-type Zn-finger protein
LASATAPKIKHDRLPFTTLRMKSPSWLTADIRKNGTSMPPTKIIVRNDGPLRVEGEIEIVDAEGRPYGLGGRTTISLCRCGHSANKPFWEGSHKAAGFQDRPEARELPPPKV